MGMVVFAAQYMVWDRILQTTRSRSFLHALYEDGVHSNFTHLSFLCVVNSWPSHRCQASKASLDEDAINRTQAFNEALLEEMSFDIMWEEYGVIGDLVVSDELFHVIITNGP